METIFRVGIAILQLNLEELLKHDMEEMLRVSYVLVSYVWSKWDDFSIVKKKKMAHMIWLLTNNNRWIIDTPSCMHAFLEI